MPAAKEIDVDHLTPFARALLDFMYDQRPSWNRSDVARHTGVNRNTIDSWFVSTRDPKRQPSLPKGPAIHAIMRVTGWTPEQMKRLTGYRELPPPGEREYVLQQVSEWPHFDGLMRRNVLEYLEDAYTRYDRLARKRPPRREQAPDVRQQPASTPAQDAETAVTSETAENHKRPAKRTPVSSGK